MRGRTLKTIDTVLRVVMDLGGGREEKGGPSGLHHPHWGLTIYLLLYSNICLMNLLTRCEVNSVGQVMDGERLKRGKRWRRRNMRRP